jgi:hypothetical protein
VTTLLPRRLPVAEDFLLPVVARVGPTIEYPVVGLRMLLIIWHMGIRYGAVPVSLN